MKRGLASEQGSASLTMALSLRARARFFAALLWPSPKDAVRMRIFGRWSRGTGWVLEGKEGFVHRIIDEDCEYFVCWRVALVISFPC